MIFVIVAAWLGLLALLVNLKILKGWTLWMKLSPFAIWLLGEVFLLIPMGSGAPSGTAVVVKHAIQIVPSVSGVVIDVSAEGGVSLQKGDVLFKIDPMPFQAEVSRLEATLREAQLDAKMLPADLAEADAEVKRFEAALVAARIQVRSLRASLTAAAALVAEHQSQLDFAESNYERSRKLVASKAVTQAGLESLERNLAVARASLEQVKSLFKEDQLALESQIGGVNTSVIQAEASMQAAQARRARAKLQLESTIQGEDVDVAQIRAQLDGRSSVSPQQYFADRIQMEGGQPAVATIAELYDELDFQRAVQAYVWATPFVALSAMFESQERDYGATLTRQGIFEQSVTPEYIVFTGNNTTIYSLGQLDLKKHGPIVLEAPAGALGGIDNHWQYPLSDIGPFGPDKGKGGKFLILPPGHKEAVPDGYFAVQSDTFQNFYLLRGVPKNGDIQGAVDMLRTARLYPLSAAANPPKMEWFNASGKPANATFPTDYKYFEVLAKHLTDEPARLRDKAMLGMLAPLGIVHGQPFTPENRVRGILERAAKVGNAMSRTIAYNSRNPNQVYAEGRKWEFIFLTKSATFETESYLDVDARVTYSHQAMFTAEGMVQKIVGAGSQYLAAYKDGDGNWLDGSQSYSLHVNPDVPVEEFWSVMVYDAETRSMIVNDQVPVPLQNMRTNVRGARYGQHL